MKRFIAIAAVLLLALSSGGMGMADTHRGGAGGMPAPLAIDAPMSGHMGDHGKGQNDRAGYHEACAIAGHSCAGYVASEMAVVTGRAFARQDWSAPSARLAIGLDPEATTPPPRA